MTPEERRYYVKNQKRYIEMYMAQHDEEVKTKKLTEFLTGKPTMNTELKDAVIELHNIARLLEKSIGKGTLSEDLRDLADKISIIEKGR
ncbi:hypothetical protein UFOVP328_390 [uncultured Caudovirales phage]|uniref:Uncharacterized protein n=1 Tax=uncultured Caudovirales phage TaxID=2100421 RepID=A0A6J5LYP9_9CAUD|nr:hypothetical protein UFOVP328_390 [uncultured Caudovirales phage]